MGCGCGLGAAPPNFNYSTYLGLQQALNYLGIPDSNGHPLTEDGTRGPATISALITMQQMAMIPADGQYGPQSQAALQQMVAQKANPLPSPGPGPSPGPNPDPGPGPSPNPVTPYGGGVAPVTPAASSSNTTLYLVGGLAVVGLLGAYFLMAKKSR